MKRVRVSIFAAFAVSFVLTAGSMIAHSSTVSAVESTSLRGPALQRVLDQRVAVTPGTAIVVGIIEGGRASVLRSGSSGTSRPLDAHTRFEIGSVTKTFTATILASMTLDHRVRLSDPVVSDLPPGSIVPERNGKQITLLTLATQHSGLPRMPDNMKSVDGDDPYAAYPLEQMLTFLRGYTLPRDPGETFEYSNFGVGLLGDALAYHEHVTYATLLQRRVFAPLGMTESIVMTPHRRDPQLASGMTMDGDRTEAWTFDGIAPAGAIASTVGDMLKYVRCAMGAGPLATVCRYAEEPRSTFPGHHIGLVWWTDDSTGVIEHGGDTSGFHSAVAVSADRQIGVVVLASGGEPVADLARHHADSRESFVPSHPSDTIALSTQKLGEYVGDYGDRDHPTLYHIRRVDDHLVAQLDGQGPARIFPDAPDHFRYHVVDASLAFMRDASGNVNGVVTTQGSQVDRMQRAGASPMASAPPATPSPDVVLESAVLDSYPGTYVIAGAGASFTVTRTASGIAIMLTGQSAYPVFATSKDHFYYRVVNATVDFERDASGAVKRLILHQNGSVVTGIR
jgi:D-alanyl-D-alanine-carboxypeptidase/D-alanyl-D-alanine-endopeptidase